MRQVRGRLAELTRTYRDGDDSDAWALVLHLMPGFEGMLPELLTAAAAVLN